MKLNRHIQFIFKQKGIWIEDGTITPKPGYIIVYSWKKKTQPNNAYSTHIGYVESVSNGQITAIEGNKGETVARRVISVGNGYIRGFAAPKYATESSAPTVPTTPSDNSNAPSKTVAWNGVVNTTAVHVRTWAGTENKTLVSYPTLSQGTIVGVCDAVNDKDGDPWYYVKISGDKGDKYGFISAVYISKQTSSAPNNTESSGAPSKEPKWVGKVTATALNVRTWAGVNNPRLKSYPYIYKNNLVDVCDTVNATDGSKWYYIRIAGKVFGFVHSA